MGKPHIRVGTSGWTYDDWSGVFYPRGITGAARLDYYQTWFNAVEVNATFYRLPTESMIRAWNGKLGAGFHLVVKGPRRVTHYRRLVDCEEPLRRFLDRVLRLRALKVILWQLPPHLHKDLGRLDAFLAALPVTVRHAVEFRHASWWDPEVDAVLKRRRVAFVIVSHPSLPDQVRPTTDFLYVRFHGRGPDLYRYDYPPEELRIWVERLRGHLKGRTLYAFFNNDHQAHAPQNAAVFRDLWV